MFVLPAELPSAKLRRRARKQRKFPAAIPLTVSSGSCSGVFGALFVDPPFRPLQRYPGAVAVSNESHFGED